MPTKPNKRPKRMTEDLADIFNGLGNDREGGRLLGFGCDPSSNHYLDSNPPGKCGRKQALLRRVGTDPWEVWEQAVRVDRISQ